MPLGSGSSQKMRKAPADNTRVAKPNYKEVDRLTQKNDSLSKERQKSIDKVNAQYGGKAIVANYLGEAILGNDDARNIMRKEREMKATSDSLKKAKRPR